MSDQEFEAIAKSARNLAGISLSQEKQNLTYSRLIKRLRQLNLNSFTQYLDLLNAQNNAKEVAAFVSALTTNVTSFFRENHHFEHISKSVLPNLINRAQNGERVRLWSSACSTGPEAYSLSMVVLETMPNACQFDFRILATDIDPNVIATAKIGRYADDELSGLNEDRRSRFLSFEQSGVGEIRQEVKDLISFKRLNLMSNWPFHGDFDVIMCRNVAIYFDKETQQNLWTKLERRLKPDGHLYIGHSERISGRTAEHLRYAGVTHFQKNPLINGTN